jgi:alpha-L-rhamnosidase
MNSHNHVMLLGDLLVWFYEYLAGIRPDTDAPGYKHVILKPEPVNGLDFVRASYDGPYGPIASNWKWEGDSFEWEVRVPPNSTADVYVPATKVRSVREIGNTKSEGKRIKPQRREKGTVVYRVGAGEYAFESTLKRVTTPEKGRSSIAK